MNRRVALLVHLLLPEEHEVHLVNKLTHKAMHKGLLLVIKLRNRVRFSVYVVSFKLVVVWRI